MTRNHLVRTMLAGVLGALVLTGTAHAQRVYWEHPGPLGAGQRAALDLVFADTEPAGPVSLPAVDGLTAARTAEPAVDHIDHQRQAQHQPDAELSRARRARRHDHAPAPRRGDGRRSAPRRAAERGRSARRRCPAAARRRGEGRRRRRGAADAVADDAVRRRGVRRRRHRRPHRRPSRPGRRHADLGEARRHRRAVERRTGGVDPTGSGVRFHTRAVAPQPGRIEVAPVAAAGQIETGRERVDPFDGFGDGFGAFASSAAPTSSTPSSRAAADDRRHGAQQLRAARRAAAAATGAGRLQRRGGSVRARVESRAGAAQDRRADHLDADPQGHRQLAGASRCRARAVPSDFRTLQPKQHKDFARGALFSGALSEDLVLVPNQPGDYHLDPVRFVYFDPAKGQYQTVEARPPVLHITGAPIAPQPKPALPHRRGVAAAPLRTCSGRRVGRPGARRRLLPREPLPARRPGTRRSPRRRCRCSPARPFVLLLCYWIALAVQRARLTDPRRPQREAFAQLAPAIERIRAAATADERVAALLDWQHTAAVALGLDVAAPTAEQLRDQRWADVWAGSERALYGRDHALPAGWCERRWPRHAARAGRASTRCAPSPLRNLVPQAATAACCCSGVCRRRRARRRTASSLRATATSPARARAWLARAKQAPSDWIARYNLGLAAGAARRPPARLGRNRRRVRARAAQRRRALERAGFRRAVPGLDRGRRRARRRRDRRGDALVSPAALAGDCLDRGGAAPLRRRPR